MDLSENRENIMAFQRFAVRRIQRFPHRSLNQTSFYGLGWVKLTTFVLIKKVLFIMTILKMEAGNMINKVFIARANIDKENPEAGSDNIFSSPVFDILNAAARISLLNTVYGMINGTTPLYSKKAWSEYVWAQAWRLEDAYWQSTFLINQDCKNLYGTMGSARYLTWWAISDKFPSTIRMCENLAKIICKCTKLKTDDLRNKGLTQSHRVCSLCDHYAAEHIEHLIMQCPVYESIRASMFNDVRKSSHSSIF